MKSLQSDSIAWHGTFAEGADALGGDTAQSQHRGPITPAKVLSWYPPNLLTPYQQDSVIQRYVKISPITWSERPDTLHLPGHPRGRTLEDILQPYTFDETFFQKSPFYHPELPNGRLGVAGEPIPYTIAGDTVLSTLLVLCFVLVAVTLAQSRRFVARQFQHFFRRPNSGTTSFTETATELRMQALLVLQTCFQLGILYLFYLQTYVGQTFTIGQWAMAGFFSASMLGYYLVKMLLYLLTGWTFFNRRSTDEWIKSMLFLTSLQGVALMPVVALQSFFPFSINTMLMVAAVIIVLFKFMVIYKTNLIFFKQKGDYVHNILYLCALETAPLLMLWGVLSMISDSLLINY